METKSLVQIQSEILQWALKNFGDVPSWQPLLGCQEELGELTHHHLKREQRIRTNEDHREGQKDSVGDLMIYLMDYCNREGLILDQIINDTWEKVSRRDWRNNKNDGSQPLSKV